METKSIVNYSEHESLARTNSHYYDSDAESNGHRLSAEASLGFRGAGPPQLAVISDSNGQHSREDLAFLA